LWDASGDAFDPKPKHRLHRNAADYHRRLYPRGRESTVGDGHSAKIIDHFFDGELEIAIDE
jgi:hypothetical protein